MSSSHQRDIDRHNGIGVLQLSPSADDILPYESTRRSSQESLGSIGSHPSPFYLRPRTPESSSSESGTRFFNHSQLRMKSHTPDSNFSSLSMPRSPSSDSSMAVGGPTMSSSGDGIVPLGWDRSSNPWLSQTEKSPREIEDWVNDWFGGMEISNEKAQNNNSHLPHPRLPTNNPKAVTLSDSAIPRKPSFSGAQGPREDPVQVLVISSRNSRVLDARTPLEIRGSDNRAGRKTRSESPVPGSLRSGASSSGGLLSPPNYYHPTYQSAPPAPSRFAAAVAAQYHSINSYGQPTTTKNKRKSSPRQGSNNGSHSPRTNSNSPRTISPRSTNQSQTKTSPRQNNSNNNSRVSPRGQAPKLASPPPKQHKNRSRGSFSHLKKEAELARFEIDLAKVISGDELRTSLMIKNIPNKYNQEMLLEAVNEHHRGTFDFFYLPIDFKNKCNVGYAFINFIDPQSIPTFFENFNCKKWSKFNSSKVCKITYARIQGKLSFVEHFRNSSLMHEDPKCRPLIFHTHGPNLGLPKPFPLPTTLNLQSRPTEDLGCEQQLISSSSGEE